MKFIDEYRDPEQAKKYAEAIRSIVSRPWTIMEVCGGQTHTIVKFGLDQFLPDKVTLLHGPGCPVCVTPVEKIDQAIDLSLRPGLILASFGDMLRVPGSKTDLLAARARGADVRMTYSPMEAVRWAEANPEKDVVFFAVGFETTAPANASAVVEAKRKGLHNFSILVSQVLVPPALDMILDSPTNRVNGFLAAGHVCTITGTREYEILAKKRNIPIVVTGFEPLDLLQGIYMCLKQLEEGRAQVENQYARVVRKEGNVPAQELMRDVFEIVDREWRGIGVIPRSGLGLSQAYADFDAEKKFSPHGAKREAASECISGLVLRGDKKPTDCPTFGTRCTPEHPLGATMVSSEGACAAYYRYRTQRKA
ncbi:MAG: hydrogenase formation protein HypD [Pseudomonadota bacterium]